MRAGSASRAASLCLLLGAAGCGTGESRPAPPPAVAEGQPASGPTAPAARPASRRGYLRALERYCSGTARAVARLAAAQEDPDDALAPVAAFAASYRTGLDVLGAVVPPPALRRFHLLTVAQARESADRLDDGVRLGRGGDIDAATTALGELPGLLPATPPAAVRRGAPACTQELG